MAETVSAQQRYKTRLRSEGMCADCPTPTNKYRCDYHEEMNRKYKREYYRRHRKPPTWPLHNRSWVRELLKQQSFTAEQAGKLAGLSGREAVDRLRQSPSLELVVLGKDPNAQHYRTSIYRVRLREDDK